MGGRYALLLLLTVAVLGATAGVMVWFFRRLIKIQEEVWGPAETKRRKAKRRRERLYEAIRGEG
ncbi:MAG: hypothetical protein ACUVWX_09475 [Kiritimatiellia bacterium]